MALAVPANTIYQMVTFEQIQRMQEDASSWEMSGVVARMLRNLPGRIPHTADDAALAPPRAAARIAR